VKGKRVSPIAVISIVIVVVAVIVGSIFILKGNQTSNQNPTTNLITKDPSVMMLTLGDLSSDYTLSVNQFFNTPEEVAAQSHPNSATVWRNWGFEAGADRLFEKTFLGDYYYVASNVEKFSNINGAQSDYEYTKSNLSDYLQPMTETIGDESFAAYIPSSLLGDMNGVYFRIKNVFVAIILTRLSMQDAILYAHIVESRIQ
jgi:hypothetical protein